MRTPTAILTFILVASACTPESQAGPPAAKPAITKPAAAKADAPKTALRRIPETSRLKLQNLYLELELAKKQLQLIVVTHQAAERDAKAIEERLAAELKAVREAEKIPETDRIVLSTGAIVPAPTAPSATH